MANERSFVVHSGDKLMAKVTHLPALIPVLLLSLNVFFGNAADSSMNLACGVTGSFRDSYGNTWVGDGSFATMGYGAKVSSYYTVPPPLNTLRYFYGIKEVCYSFKLVPVGTMVTVTTQFYYGNYDNNYSPPTFGVQYDSNDAYAVVTSTSSVVKYTLSYRTQYEKIYVCLGTPYPYDNVLFLNTLQISGPGVDPDNNTPPSAGNNTDDKPAPRSSGSPPASDNHKSNKKTGTIIAIVVSIVVGLPLLVGLGALLCCFLSSQRRRRSTNDIPQVQRSPGPPGDPHYLGEYPPVPQDTPTNEVSGTYPESTRSSENPLAQSSSYHSQSNTSQVGSSVSVGGKMKPGTLVQINHVFSYSDIIEITKNFEWKIGKGGSGVVFYGKLKDDREVAVKVLNDSLPQGAKEFASEVQLLLTVHHKCIAGFVGYCEEGQSLILIYEYMKGGNLRELLSDTTGSKSGILPWEKRLQMAQSIATGLDYLHSGCQKPIIHRDVKTTNVLLNDKMEAKIADFGLSKAGIDEDVTFVSTVVAGTPGYIDPEYYNTNRLTTKSDVYSFGVVLLELISGHSPIMVADGKRYSLVQWAVPQIEGNDIESVADPRLRGQYNVESMWRVAQAAAACLLESSEQRPTMEDVVSEIKAAIEVQTRLGATTVDFRAGGFPASSPSGFADFAPASTHSNADQYADPSHKAYGPAPMGR